MASRDELRTLGLRAYELGRLRSALKVAIVLVPLAAVCLYESRGREACACLAAGLLGLCIWLRWRDRRGLDAVSTGLKAGSIPLVTGLVLDSFDLRCSLAGGASFCAVVAVLVGGVAGILVAVRQSSWNGRLSSWMTAGLVAALAASLGCLRLGIIGLVSVVVGIGAGTVLTARAAASQ